MWPSNYPDSDRYEPAWFDRNNNVLTTSSNIYQPAFLESGVVEPITLAIAKSHCRVDFTDDDALITLYITACRKTVEKYTSLSLVPKTVTLTLDLIAPVEIPFGPFVSLTSFVDQQGNAITSDFYQLSTDPYPKIRPLTLNYYKAVMVYTAGYANGTVDEDLQLAILNEIAFRYENRGDAPDTRKSVNPGICESAQVLADPYRRYSWV